MNSKNLILLATVMATAIPGQLPSFAQGMPPEARRNIHTLFNQHDKVTRSVQKTDKGYVAITESEDPKVAAALKEHVRQMSARLESGLRVRQWDPAFAEYVKHYSDIEHRFTKTLKGVRMTVTGKTPAAIQAAQNHAAVISSFVQDGWESHDRLHPAATTTGEASVTTPASTNVANAANAAPSGCCRQRTMPAGCCLQKSAK